MYEWTGTTWLAIAPPALPPPRTGTALATDVVRNRVVLHGGSSATQIFNDTWEWDGGTWTQIISGVVAILARGFHAMAFDPLRNETVLFGGQGIPGNDTWTWNGVTWDPASSGTPAVKPLLAPDGVRPEPREGRPAGRDRGSADG
jgi:hypothetical protein